MQMLSSHFPALDSVVVKNKPAPGIHCKGTLLVNTTRTGERQGNFENGGGAEGQGDRVTEGQRDRKN
jgi:hypothetical protein